MDVYLALALVLLQSGDPEQKAPANPIAVLPLLFPNTLRPESAISPDRTRLAFSTRDEGIWVLDLDTQQVDLRIPATEHKCLSMAWSPNGSTLSIIRDKGVVDLVDAKSGAVQVTLHDDASEGRWWTDEDKVVFLDGGARVLTGLGDRHLDLWSTKDGKRLRRFSMREGAELTTFAVARSGELVAAGSDKGDVCIWNLRTPELPVIKREIPSIRKSRYILSLDFNPAGDVLAIGGGDCHVRLWKFGGTEPFRELVRCDMDWFEKAAVGAVRWSPDGKRLLSISANAIWEACVWDVETATLVGNYDYGGGDDRPITGWFSTDGSYVVCTLGGVVGKLESGGRFTFEHPPPENANGWFRSDRDVVWGWADGYFMVRRIFDREPFVKIRSGWRDPK